MASASRFLEGLCARRPRRTMTLTAMEFLRRFVQQSCRAASCASASRDSSRTPVAQLAWPSPEHCSPHRGTGSRRDRATRRETYDPRNVGLSTVRRGDDHRADPLGAPARDRHMGFRQLVSSAPHQSRDIRANVIGPRLGRGVRRPRRWSPPHRHSPAHAPPAGGRRRRSRAAGLSMSAGPRSGIPIPAP